MATLIRLIVVLFQLNQTRGTAGLLDEASLGSWFVLIQGFGVVGFGCFSASGF